MKKIGFILISSMLLLMNSCSETSPLEPNGFSDEAAVRFTTTMQPTVEVKPTRAMILGETLPERGEVGIFGIRTQTVEELSTTTWKDATFHRQMKNKQYLVEEGNTLSPNGELDYHPMGDSLLTVCAYMPYSEAVTADGYLPVNLSEQTDVLYTGIQTVQDKTQAIELSFKHALGAVAFRFYTEEESLDGTAIRSIILNTNYSSEGVKVNVADGTFLTEGNSGICPIDLSGNVIRYAEESADVMEAVGHTMLPAGRNSAGRNCLITGLALNYGESEVASTVLETPVELTAGKVSVLRIKCNLQNTSVLQLATRTTTAADTEVTFTLEKMTTE